MPLDVRGEFPALDSVPRDRMTQLILDAKMSPKDVEIATCRLIWSMDYPAICAALGMDRNAVYDRLKKRIIPHMMQVWTLSGKNEPTLK